MKDVARIVSQIDALQLDRAVVDGTEIGGTYDLVLSRRAVTLTTSAQLDSAAPSDGSRQEQNRLQT